MSAMSPYERPVVRVHDLAPDSPARPAQVSPRRGHALLRWIVGFLIVVIAIFALAKSIPAAPRPTLGPPSSPATSAVSSAG